MIIQWLGHSAFKLTANSTSVLIDPFLTGNPKFSGDAEETMDGVSHVLLTHGHNDHFGDTMAILEKTSATLVSTYELTSYVSSVREQAKTIGMNTGGTLDAGAFKVSMVQAFHSSSYQAPDGRIIYGGMPTGLIVEMDGHRIYHMGDTAIFSDMALINELHRPDIGIVPIGGLFTMDAKTAALAVNRYFSFDAVLPCHYLTFPILAQSAVEFVAAVDGAKVLTPDPMQAVEI